MTEAQSVGVTVLLVWFWWCSIVSILPSIVSLALPSFRFRSLSFHLPFHRFDFALYRFTWSSIVSISLSIVSLGPPLFRFRSLSFHLPFQRFDFALYRFTWSSIVSISLSITLIFTPSLQFHCLSLHSLVHCSNLHPTSIHKKSSKHRVFTASSF
ncbi:hypothetical protein J2S05_002136 [Alkalicoccobacillus murimartini]|uniref:Uncharacterized protein n=1 Tax=Alkalicoccobacillus murimartini TaxID=171685 RepID=A0ABT9YHJ6_9BACI|nr:hypothetical protein [Alkalicoccobacillus murimartini]